MPVFRAPVGADGDERALDEILKQCARSRQRVVSVVPTGDEWVVIAEPQPSTLEKRS
jgi:hypothetical protein